MTEERRKHITRRDFLKYSLCTSLFGAAAAGFLTAGCKGGSTVKPDIFLITVDTLRPDYLGCYGYNRNTSPNIDAFAKDGMVFENCIAHGSETASSFSSIFSGFLPHETKIFGASKYSGSIRTIADILQHCGYSTVAVVSNYVLKKGKGWEQGFSIYDDQMNQSEESRLVPERIAEDTSDRAIELLDRYYDKTQPFFMWVHYQDPHGPYTPPEPFKSMFQGKNRKNRPLPLNSSVSGRGGIPSYQALGQYRDYNYYESLYQGEIRYQDKAFKRLTDKLKQLNLYDTAMIFFSSDHGEGMGEHDYYFAHGEYLYQSLIHVPLILKYGSKYKGRRTDFVQHADILPTILNSIGKKPDSRLRGQDLRYSYKNQEIISEMNLPSLKDGLKFSIIRDPFKLIYTNANQKYELYNIRSDKQEKQNLVAHPQYAEQYEYLKERLLSVILEDRLQIKADQNAPELSNEEKKKLKSLGYVR
jgi:arylsulfatase